MGASKEQGYMFLFSCYLLYL